MAQITNVTMHVVNEWKPDVWTFKECEVVAEIEGDAGRLFVRVPRKHLKRAGEFVQDAYDRWPDVKAQREKA